LAARRTENPSPPSDLLLKITGDADQEKNAAIGEGLLRLFIELCELKPSEDVLEIGCGVGRVALPLTRYLDPEATYEGLDVVAEAIDWCVANITSGYPNFRFRQSDIFNRWYNPDGRTQAKDYRFPYEDEAFDFAFLTSVFTHMFPEDVENYLFETTRVLKPGARVLLTFFLLNEESIALMKKGEGFVFEHEFDGFRAASREVPEATIALHEEFVLDLLRRCGLVTRTPIHYGVWAGDREGSSVYQDTIVADVT
jgi:SAM-dependent methyltransferase